MCKTMSADQGNSLLYEGDPADKPAQMKAGRERGVQLIHTQQSIPIFSWLQHSSLVLYSSSPSFHIQQFVIDQQIDATCP